MQRVLINLSSSVLLALAGCASQTPAARTGTAAHHAHATRVAAAGHHRQRRYIVHRGPGREDWTVVCDDEGPGQQSCRIETAIKQASPSPSAATIASGDGGKSWMVATMPNPGAARLQVGRRQPVDADCSLPGDACTITGEAADRLTHDFQAGAQLSAQVLTSDGEMDRTVSLHGFSRELEKARAKLPPGGAAPVLSPAAPPGPAAVPATPDIAPAAR